MRYMMFVAVDTEPDSAPDDGPTIDEWFGEISAEQHVDGERLRPVEDARLVRVLNGDELVTDAAFTESKEWIAGFDILECEAIDQAISTAAKHPMARQARIEVREFWPLSASSSVLHG